MIAKRLENLLGDLSSKADVAHGSHNEFGERFDSLLRNGRLPRGRDKRADKLTSGEIAAAVLGIVTPSSAWSGHASIVLTGLRSVGGSEASFFGCATLQEVIECVLNNETARASLIKLTVTAAEVAINAHGMANVTYVQGTERRKASYVPREAVSLLQPGAEKTFDPDLCYSPVSRETTFNRAFFDRLVREVKYERLMPGSLGDGSEYDVEEAEARRYAKLGVRPDSRYVNIGVDNQVTWPKEEILTKFDSYSIVLMPKTEKTVQSVHIDLTANRLSDREAMTVINRFLSVLTWCDDQFAVAQDGWSGNPVPVPVAKRDLAFTTAPEWAFDRRISVDQGPRVLALYREARNAEQNFMVSYAVLNYFKIIETKHSGRAEVIKWFGDNFQHVYKDGYHRDELARFAKSCGTEKPQDYIYKSCRIAVAHAGKHSKSDPDDADELARLHTAAHIMRILARYFILHELGISDVRYSGA